MAFTSAITSRGRLRSRMVAIASSSGVTLGGSQSAAPRLPSTHHAVPVEKALPANARMNGPKWARYRCGSRYIQRATGSAAKARTMTPIDGSMSLGRAATMTVKLSFMVRIPLVKGEDFQGRVVVHARRHLVDVMVW